MVGGGCSLRTIELGRRGRAYLEVHDQKKSMKQPVRMRPFSLTNPSWLLQGLAKVTQGVTSRKLRKVGSRGWWGFNANGKEIA